MKISLAATEMDLKGRKGWHILTVAESGFSALTHYAGEIHRLDALDTREFADKVNELDQAGSLHPKAPISALPCRFFRDYADAANPAAMMEFRQCLLEFLEANNSTIKASRIFVDFHVTQDAVPLHFIEASEEVFRNGLNTQCIKEVVISI